jgi:pimeloyl-ACP methyl ester carboxylesterase/predicted glycosyltransferase
MRASSPIESGVLDRDGTGIAYEVHGDGATTLLMVPPAPITHSRIYKAQVPFLARHFRVVTLDARGNGKSARPPDVNSHTRQNNIDDMVAVLDETRTTAAILVAHCHANWWAVDFAAAHPDRVLGLVAIEPGVPYVGRPQPHWVEAAAHWEETLADPHGWELFNKQVIVDQHSRWVEWFFSQQLVEPHSTKQFEDAVRWALDSTGDVLVAGEEGIEIDAPSREELERSIARIDYPVLVIHGELDICQHVDRGRAFAESTGADFLLINGGGHLPIARDPVKINSRIKRFVDQVVGVPMNSSIWTRGLHRRKKALFLSSPIGLGHARRDLAIAAELRLIKPDVQIEWLAQHPVTSVLSDAGETVHPASEWLVSESAHIESEAAGHDLHCFQALRRMDEILVANFMVFQEVIEEGMYDVIIGDESWDVDYYWHENPELKRGSHVWLTDFVGYLPMPDGGDHEAYLTADYNAEMIEHIARFPRIRDRAIFVGNADDIVPEVFGPNLPKIRDWTQEHFEFSGYITGFTPPSPDQAAEWRTELGYREDEMICLVTVGGSGVGRALLEKAIAAYPIARETVPELRMVVIAGPRIDPESLPSHAGLEVHGYVDRLYRHLSVCDLAVVQGGLTTTMELTAAGRPFIYFPLTNHFEQTYHVRYRLDQYGAGRCMNYNTTGVEELASAIATEIGRSTSYRPVETNGATRAAKLMAELI